jgi:ELWxxDGT repeat protein
MPDLTAVGDILFFTAETYSEEYYSGVELWKSDGTEEGTVLLKDLTPEGSSYPGDLVAVDGVLFFASNDQNDDRELWRSDGTETGTFRTQDLAPGPFSSSPRGMTLAGSRLFFSADDVVLGREPWAGRAAILAHRPDRAMADLRAEVEDLGLPEGTEQSLITKLRDRGSGPRSEPWQLRSARAPGFVHEVEGLSSGLITAEARASLLQFAQEILDLLAEEVPVSPLPPQERRPGGTRRTGETQPSGRWLAGQ